MLFVWGTGSCLLSPWNTYLNPASEHTMCKLHPEALNTAFSEASEGVGRRAQRGRTRRRTGLERAASRADWTRKAPEAEGRTARHCQGFWAGSERQGKLAFQINWTYFDFLLVSIITRYSICNHRIGFSEKWELQIDIDNSPFDLFQPDI